MDESENNDLKMGVNIKTEDGASPTRKTWDCKECDKIFTHKAGLYNHMKKKHGRLVYAKASITCREEGCNFKCSMREKLQAHLVSVHKKLLAFSTLKFSCMKEFELWKELFEKQERCRFVKKSGTRVRKNSEKHTYLYCSRSGTFISNSKGKRTQMKKGTSKISNYCTASIDCVEMRDGTVIAKLCSTHYGHEPSLEYLRLTKTDKTNIASKLAQGLPRDMVIDNVRASVGENVDRVHFLTMKDIRNIERSYGIKPESKHRSSLCGFTSIHDWVKDMEELGEDNPVMYYKQKYDPVTDASYSCLSLDDFCLVLTTKGQNELLKKFGQCGVFYITWMAICNGYNLSLLTLMVADDLNEAFPVAYMICSKASKETEMLFFNVIRSKVGTFSARAILTDDKRSLYDNWCSVMGFVPYHLLSNRYVDADWRDRLISVQNEDLQCAIYEVLYSYLSSTDPNNFEENLKMFSKHLKSSEETSVFGQYFEDNYLHRVHLWAGCYDKKNVGINEHLNLDCVYNELLSVCNNKGKFAKLLDKTLQGLLTIVRDRQYHRTSKITKQAQELIHHHSVSMNIDIEGISEMENRKWQIKSETANLMFTVNRKTYECSSRCPLICSDCKLCAHMFECTCKVYNFDRTMCKHIHAVGRLFRKNCVEIPGIDSELNESVRSDKDTSLNESSEMSVNDNESQVPNTPIILEMTTGEEKFAAVVRERKMKASKRQRILQKVIETAQNIESEVVNVEEIPVLRKILSRLRNVESLMGFSAEESKTDEDIQEDEEEELEEEDNEEEDKDYKAVVPQVKRGRGRPRIHPVGTPQPVKVNPLKVVVGKRKVGRPRKYAIEEPETVKEPENRIPRKRGRPRIKPEPETPEPKKVKLDPEIRRSSRKTGKEEEKEPEEEENSNEECDELSSEGKEIEEQNLKSSTCNAPNKEKNEIVTEQESGTEQESVTKQDSATEQESVTFPTEQVEEKDQESNENNSSSGKDAEMNTEEPTVESTNEQIERIEESTINNEEQTEESRTDQEEGSVVDNEKNENTDESTQENIEVTAKLVKTNQEDKNIDLGNDKEEIKEAN